MNEKTSLLGTWLVAIAAMTSSCNKKADEPPGSNATSAPTAAPEPKPSATPEPKPPATTPPVAAADPKGAVRKRAMGYSKLLTQMRERTVTVDEVCEFFTCDSLTTHGDVEALLKEQTKVGRNGWRIMQANVPESRITMKPNGEVSALVEEVIDLACQTPGDQSDSDDGALGCKKANPRPWKRECYNMVYTFIDVGGQWKRTGRSQSTKIGCP